LAIGALFVLSTRGYYNQNNNNHNNNNHHNNKKYHSVPTTRGAGRSFFKKVNLFVSLGKKRGSLSILNTGATSSALL
jgi:hypothetical protein